MDQEARKRVNESKRSVPKSKNPGSFAASSSDPAPSGAPKKKLRRRKEAESEKVFLLQDPGILEQKEENGKVYYLLNWADDPDTKEQFKPSWEPYDNVALDVVADWQSRRSPVEGARAQGAADSQNRRIIDLTGDDEDSIQDSQSPRPAKRRRITHGPNPTSEEKTPEKKPRKVGTAESARFQSVPQELVAQKEKPHEIKDSYEDDQQLSAAGVGKAWVEIPGPQESFDREAYSRVITSSQPSQPSNTSQISQGSHSQDPSSSQFQTPAPRHRYSSLIWDEDIEGVVPDSQELGSSSYVPSTTQVSKTVSTSPENSELHTETDIEAAGYTQVTSGGISSSPGIIDTQSGEAINALTQASYFDSGVQSSSIPTESSGLVSSDRNQTRAQESFEIQAIGSELSGIAVASSVIATRFEEGHNSSPELKTSSDSALYNESQAFPARRRSSPAREEAESSHDSVAQPAEEQSFPPLFSTHSPQLSQISPRVEPRDILDEVPSSPPNLPTPHDSHPSQDNSIERHSATRLPSYLEQSLISEVQESSSIAFGTQVPFQRFEGKEDHFAPSSPFIRSDSPLSSSASLPSISAALIESQPTRHQDQPDFSTVQEIEQSQTVQPESYQPQEPLANSSAHTGPETQVFVTAPATPVQTPREDLDGSSVERISSSISGSPSQDIEIHTQFSPLNSQVLGSQRTSAEQRSQPSSNSLPSPPFEKTDSSEEPFAQLASHNRPRTPLNNTHSLGSTVDQLSPSLRLSEDIHTMAFQQSQPSQPSLGNSTMDDPTASASPSTNTPVKEDSPILAKLRQRKAELLAKKAAERELAASASRSLPQSPAALSPALQSPALSASGLPIQTPQPRAEILDFQQPVLQQPAPVSPVPELPAALGPAAANDAAVLANQALPIHSTVEEVESGLEPIVSPTISPEIEVEPEAELAPTTLRVLPQGRDEYVIPLPMVSHARDVYVNAIRSRKKQRYEFLTDEVFDTDLVREIDAMMKELDLLCSHQDLIQEDFSTQRMEEYSIQAKWAENVSTKCIFLVEFLSSMQTEAKQIAILVRPGRMLEIIEAVFNWHSFVYSRADRPGYTGNTSGGPMKITLIPTLGEILEIEPPSIVIAFDSTSTSIPFMKDLRTNPSSPATLVPLLSLIVVNSIEHLEKCFSRNIEPVERKIKLVSCLTQIKDNVGKLGIGYYDPPAAASAIANYVMNGTIEGTWPLKSLPDIEDLQLDVDSSQSQQPQDALSEMLSSGISRAQNSQFGTKRQLAIEDDESRESPKRQRLTPIAGEPDPSHISETVLHTSSRKDPSASAGVSEIRANADALDDMRKRQLSSMLKKVTDLEIQLRRTEASESELRQMNQDLEARCQDLESSIASIQPKYQEALDDRGEFEHEKNLANARQEHLRKELESKDNEVTKLRDLKATLEKELVEARTALSSSAIPEIAEMGRLKEELLQERSEKERLQKRLTNMQGDLEYMRNNYQNSSTLAAEHASENQTLQAELAKLREKAKQDMVHIHEIQKNNENKEYIRRVKELQGENSELERELEKKQDELKALMNGRRATRGTSVPRSPHMGTGGTMSPGPRPMGRAMQMGNIGMAMSGGNGGSRGNSPAPGDLGGFRGTGTFVGEALFQDNRPPGGVRWGTHLQQ